MKLCGLSRMCYLTDFYFFVPVSGTNEAIRLYEFHIGYSLIHADLWTTGMSLKQRAMSLGRVQRTATSVILIF